MPSCYAVSVRINFKCHTKISNGNLANLMFVDPCIIVKFTKKIQRYATVYQIFFISYLYEAQHVSGDIPPIIRSLKLH